MIFKRMTIGGAIPLYRRDRRLTKGDPASRLALMIKWAAVKVIRRSGKSHFEIRGASNRMKRRPRGRCFVCGQHNFVVKHHVIQLQHGGNNNHLNIEMVCDACHCAIHPWLSETRMLREGASPKREPANVNRD